MIGREKIGEGTGYSPPEQPTDFHAEKEQPIFYDGTAQGGAEELVIGIRYLLGKIRTRIPKACKISSQPKSFGL
jgi:hypothetical protein